MGIKNIIINEIELRKKLRGIDRRTCKDIAIQANISYSTLMKWINNEDRSISDSSLDKIADCLGKRIVIIDK